MAARTPPKYVPTLTDVVRSDASSVRAVPGLTEDQLVARVMQRIDLTLERKLREAIAAAVLEQTRMLGPILREEIEQVVRDAVSQAFAEGPGATSAKPRK